MGTAATTLSTLLNRKVVITTPRVELTTTGELSDEYPIPFVAIDVKYKSGLEGSNVLILKIDDVKVITDIMMGKDEIDFDRELTELDLSAASEVMNQMMGSAATSLSEVFLKRIDIEPPTAHKITFSEGRETLDVLKKDDPIIKISFKMVVEDLIDSQIMQLIPLKFGQEIVESLLSSSEVKSEKVAEAEEVEKAEVMVEAKVDRDLNKHIPQKKVETKAKEDSIQKDHVVVKKPEFETFDTISDISYSEPIDLVGDIPVELTVELGRTTKTIGEILEYGPGTVIELDKLVGEPLNIYANGKFIAKGEVVVIDDNFGVRITDIDNS